MCQAALQMAADRNETYSEEQFRKVIEGGKHLPSIFLILCNETEDRVI